MDALSNIGNFLSSTGGKTLLGIGTAGGGLVQNLIANKQANDKQKFVQDLITNPAKFNSLVAQTEQPLSQGLTTDIARQADAYGAERGLGSSPAVMKDVYAQALAPAMQTEQQMAINSLLSRLGIYAQQPTMKPVDVSSIFKALSMSGSPATPYPTGTWGGGGVGSTPDPALATVGAMPGYVPPAPSQWNIPATLPSSTVDYNTGDFFSSGNFG